MPAHTPLFVRLGTPSSIARATRLANVGTSAQSIHISVLGDPNDVRSVKLKKHFIALKLTGDRHVPITEFIPSLSLTGQMEHGQLLANNDGNQMEGVALALTRLFAPIMPAAMMMMMRRWRS